MASKAIDPTTTNDMCLDLFTAAKLRFLRLLWQVIDNQKTNKNDYFFKIILVFKL